MPMPMPIPTTDPSFNLNPIRTKPPPFTTTEARISCRRLSLDIPTTDTTATSFDVYYRASPLSIPFLWESQPGTPKIKSREFQIPPLTPPPSFHSSPNVAGIPRKHHKHGLATAAILPRLSLNRKAQFLQRPRSPPSSRSSCSSPPLSTPSPSASGTPTTTESKQRRSRRWAAATRDNSGGAEESDENESPVSTLCFRRRGGMGRTRATRGCPSSVMKILMRGF